MKSFSRFIPVFVIIGYLYWLLRKYLTNKKVKEMDAKTYAKIIEVDVQHDTEWDSESNRYVTTTTYFFNYEYHVGGMNYTGRGSSQWRKKEGQEVKIYYNEMKPEKSETAKEHNLYLRGFILAIVILMILYSIIRMM